MSRAVAEWVISPDADPLHPRAGDLADCFERHAAGGFEFDGRREGVAAGDSFAKHVRRHVVEEHDVGTCAEDVFELI